MSAAFLTVACWAAIVASVAVAWPSVLAVVPDSDVARALRAAVGEADARDPTGIIPRTLTLGYGTDVLTDLCENLRSSRPALIVSLLPDRARTFLVSLTAGHAGLPMIDLAHDLPAKDVNPLYVGLGASPRDLASAVSAVINITGWGQDIALVGRPDSREAASWARTLGRRLGDLTAARRGAGRVVAACCEGTAMLRSLSPEHWLALHVVTRTDGLPTSQPTGALGLRPRSPPNAHDAVRPLVALLAEAVRGISPRDLNISVPDPSCWFSVGERRRQISAMLYRAVMKAKRPPELQPAVEVVSTDANGTWTVVGRVTGGLLSLAGPRWSKPREPARPRYRVVTAMAPPFALAATRVSNGSCLSGLPCLHIPAVDKEELRRLFADYHGPRQLESRRYNISCCAGIAMDLLAAACRDLRFEADLYVVADGSFSGVTADLVSGAAHLAFTAYSLTARRATLVDFSVPYLHSGISVLTYSQLQEVPLSAFLIPFSYQLWFAIFVCLNITAVFAAIYEWLSPFGLNPWGRQRTKNFSLASALWVMWSLLFSHLVAFKAPKSWPNKVLINLWGCFSVIFVSSYTANIAALFAGLFFRLRVSDFYDMSLMSQKTGLQRASAVESYIQKEKGKLWEHVQRYRVDSIEAGIEKLRRTELDVLIGDLAILDYYRGNDPSCSMHLIGETMVDDSYAVGLRRGLHLKEQISSLILRYNEFGFLDQLRRKWYGRVPCFDESVHRLNKPQALGVRTVAGVFIMLGVGLLAGVALLVLEHLVFRYSLPRLRESAPGTVWRNPNLMFLSQKLFRFINTVELVSPHHSAKEIVTNLREGQIASLFQKSVKRKAKEEARRRKSKSQFFETFLEIRKVVRQQNERRALTEAYSPPYRPCPQAVAAAEEVLLRPVASPPPPLSASADDLPAATSPGNRHRRRWSMDDLGSVRSTVPDRPLPAPPTLAPRRPVDEFRLFAMTKEEIVRRWQASERSLLNRLRETLREKRALEEKLAFIQRTLLKPP